MNATDIPIQIGGGVALLLWGVRMVRTGMTRAYGARLRQAIGACAARRIPAFAIGDRCDARAAEQHRDHAHRHFLCRTGTAVDRGRARRRTGGRCRHDAGGGADVVPPAVAAALAADGGRRRVHDRPGGPCAASGPRRHWSRPHAPVAAPADGHHGAVARRRGPGTGTGQPRRRTARGRAGGDAADLDVAFEPGDRAAARLAGGQSPARAVTGIGPGARRQSRQQPRLGADHGGRPQCCPAHSAGAIC